MISCKLTIWVFFCATVVKAQFPIPPCDADENLQEEYYTTTNSTTYEVLPQDDLDAQEIIDSNRNETVIASIFSSRTKTRRYAINEQITARTAGKMPPWINDTYVPRDAKPCALFTDLCFCMVTDDGTVLGNYLGTFLATKDLPSITIGMVLTKDIQGMIATFDNHFGVDAFKGLRKSLQFPYENMLRVWVGQNREPLETQELNQDFVKKDGKLLSDEEKKDGWHEHRDQLETTLMKKSIKYARAVIAEFERLNDGKLIEDIILENTHNRGLDPSLGDAYASLAVYIKNKYAYIVRTLLQRSDGTDRWSAWDLCIAVLNPDEWIKVNEEYKKQQTTDTLSTFIVQKNTDDKIMAELMAVVVDPSYQPKTFAKKPIPTSPPPSCSNQPTTPTTPSITPTTPPTTPTTPPTTPTTPPTTPTTPPTKPTTPSTTPTTPPTTPTTPPTTPTTPPTTPTTPPTTPTTPPTTPTTPPTTPTTPPTTPTTPPTTPTTPPTTPTTPPTTPTTPPTTPTTPSTTPTTPPTTTTPPVAPNPPVTPTRMA